MRAITMRTPRSLSFFSCASWPKSESLEHLFRLFTHFPLCHRIKLWTSEKFLLSLPGSSSLLL